VISMFLKVVFQFVLLAGDPQWSCQLAHRDPGIPATMYLYCARTMPDGLEVISVGKYLPDVAATKAP
jgi:hypothetical protein